MHLRISGKKKTVTAFLKELSTKQTKGKENVRYPESYRYSRDCDHVSITCEYEGDFVDFGVLKEYRFRGLEVVCDNAACRYKKLRGSTSISKEVFTEYKSELKNENNQQPRLESEKDIDLGELEKIEENELTILDEYSTLELYEERKGKLHA